MTLPEDASDATYAIWHEPSAYDPLLQGPPYLPRSLQVGGKTASGIGLPGAPLAKLVAALRAVSMVHQSNHWQTRGQSFYGDHLLFERLYNESLGTIDRLAERTINVEGSDSLKPSDQAKIIAFFIDFLSLSNANDSEGCVQTSLRAEQALLSCLKGFYDESKVKGTLSLGLDNLLQEIADQHESFVYLLQQRVSRTDPWKVAAKHG